MLRDEWSRFRNKTKLISLILVYGSCVDTFLIRSRFITSNIMIFYYISLHTHIFHRPSVFPFLFLFTVTHIQNLLLLICFSCDWNCVQNLQFDNLIGFSSFLSFFSIVFVFARSWNSLDSNTHFYFA